MVMLAGCGSIIESYEFFIIIIYSIQIGKTFFPVENPILASLSTFLVFFLSWIARPIGGLVFGHYGDSNSRKKTFSYSLIWMAIASISISLLPAFDSVGIISPILFVIFRILQGIAIGGEVAGAITYVYEQSRSNKYLSCAIVVSSLTFGIILANIISFLLEIIIPSVNVWRIAIFIGGFFGLIGVFLRFKLKESSMFLQKNNKGDIPLLSLLANYKASLVLGFLISGIQATLTIGFIIFLPTYLLLKINIETIYVSLLSIVSLFCLTISVIIGGYIFVNKPVTKLYISGISSIPTAFFLLYSLNHESYFSILLMMIFSFFAGIFGGTYSAYIASIFPTNVRYTGVGIANNIAYALFGGLVPSITLILMYSLASLYAPAIVLSVIISINLLLIFYLISANKMSN